MLNFFRRGGVGQAIVAAVVFAVIIVFVIEFRAGSNRGGSNTLTRQCAVETADSCVERKEFFAAYGLIVPRGMSPKQLRSIGLRKYILDGLLERELLVQEADRLGIDISEEQIDAELAAGRAHVSLPSSLPGYLAYSIGIGAEGVRYLPVKSQQTDAFDYKIYERVVRTTTNRSPREFKEMQHRELIAARMRDLVRSRVRISEAEAYRRFEREHSKAVVRFVQLNRDWFGKYAVDLTDAGVDAWSAENKAQLDEAWSAEKAQFTADCPLTSEIFVSVDPGATESDKTLTRDRIDAARRRVVDGGESFASVARTASDAPTASLGGELGCLGESHGPGGKDLMTAVNALKPGEVSPVIEAPNGFYVLRLDGKLDAAQVETVGRRQLARRLAARFKADERAKQFGTDLLQRVKGGAKLDDATRELANQYALPLDKANARTAQKPKTGEAAVNPALEDATRPKVEISAPFGPASSPIPTAQNGEQAAAAAFAIDKPDQLHPELLDTFGGFAVMQLKEKEVASREEFAKNKPELLRQLREPKEQEAVTRYVAQLKSAAAAKTKLNAELLEEPKQGANE